MHFSEPAPQITPETGLKTKAPKKILFCSPVLSINLLKISSPYITLLLCHIWNKILSSGINIPEDNINTLKYSVIKPTFQNGYRSDMFNYRPISLFILIF